ncbi:MAG: prenyltransferase/squalene oxidase repeat-containing protein, partial [Myxococcota bacterium]
MRLQKEEGYWHGAYGGPLFLLPGFLIVQSITGFSLSAKEREGMLAYLTHVQNSDGGFGLHEEGPSTVFGTALNYVALRLLGLPLEASSAHRAQVCLLRLGGAESIPTWGKFWLAVLGVYQWNGVVPLPPEMWILPRFLPIHPGRYWCHSRAVF